MTMKNDMKDQYIYLAAYDADEVLGVEKLSPVESGKIAMLRELGYVEISHADYEKHIVSELKKPVTKESKKIIVVTTDKKFTVHGIQYTIFFTMVDNGDTKQTLYAEVSSSEDVDSTIAEVIAFFPDDYEFEFN